MDSAVSRRPCFVEVKDGLASIADMEAGSSGNHHSFLSRSLLPTKRSSFRNLSASSPRSVRFYDTRFEEPHPHFLHACSLCKKSLGDNRDIFMYRGDTPFCSEDCRQEQIEIDEAKEKWNLSSSVKALRNSTSPNKKQGYAFRTSTIAAA